MENNNPNPIQIVTIKEKFPLTRPDGSEVANSIEYVSIEENDFMIVSQKDLYRVGDKAMYIQPDYCLSLEVSLFYDFIMPFGDPNKTKLGKGYRIRAVKFNFLTPKNQIAYSEGILMPISEVEKYLGRPINLDTIQDDLKVIKSEMDEGNYPSTIYKTDETNFKNNSSKLSFPERYIGTLKVDGCSISIICINDMKTVASRTTIEELTLASKVGEEIVQVENTSEYVKYGKPYLDKLIEYCEKNNMQIILRGELHGQGIQNSNNKNNPHKMCKPSILFYGVDIFGVSAKKASEAEMSRILGELGFERVPVIFDKIFESKEELTNTCDEYFTANLSEGIVIRDIHHNYSGKYMCAKYDSLK